MDQVDLKAPPLASDTPPGLQSDRALSPEALREAVLAKLTYSVGKDPVAASQRDWFLAVAFATRDIIVDRWMNSTPRNLSG